jgi:hypothetical protein
MGLLAALAACLGCAFAILGEIASVMLGAAAAVAVLTTLAARFGSTLAIIGEIARAVLPADMTRTRCLLTILGKVARVPRMSLVRHAKCSFVSRLTGIPVPTATGADRVGLSSRLP